MERVHAAGEHSETSTAPTRMVPYRGSPSLYYTSAVEETGVETLDRQHSQCKINEKTETWFTITFRSRGMSCLREP